MTSKEGFIDVKNEYYRKYLLEKCNPNIVGQRWESSIVNGFFKQFLKVLN